MRIHTNTLTRADIITAAQDARVTFERLDAKGSRSHLRAFDVLLSGSSPRRAQSGDYQAATWDEWGIFIARLFALDPEAKIGIYRNVHQFHRVTGDRFRTLTHDQQHRAHKWEWSRGPGSRCACGCHRAAGALIPGVAQ